MPWAEVRNLSPCSSGVFQEKWTPLFRFGKRPMKKDLTSRLVQKSPPEASRTEVLRRRGVSMKKPRTQGTFRTNDPAALARPRPHNRCGLTATGHGLAGAACLTQTGSRKAGRRLGMPLSKSFRASCRFPFRPFVITADPCKRTRHHALVPSAQNAFRPLRPEPADTICQRPRATRPLSLFHFAIRSGAARKFCYAVPPSAPRRSIEGQTS